MRNWVGKIPWRSARCGVAMSFVPEDRLGMGLVGNMGMTGQHDAALLAKGQGHLPRPQGPAELAERIWKELEVVTPSTNFPVRRMSGGNVQKVLVGPRDRSAPTVLMTAYAVRGLDINTSYTIYNLLNRAEDEGRRRHLRRRGSGRAAGAVRPHSWCCAAVRSGIVDGRTTNKRK